MSWKDDLPGIDEDEYLAAWAFDEDADDDDDELTDEELQAYSDAFDDNDGPWDEDDGLE